MHPLPLFTSVTDQSCIVVGGGAVALRRVNTLIAAGARVVVIAPVLCEELANNVVKYNENRQLTWLSKIFSVNDLICQSNQKTDKPRLVIAATNDADTNNAIAVAARQQHIMCNVADNPAAGDFSFASTINRDPITIAISSQGSSPVLTRLIKAKIERLIPQGYSQLAKLASTYRQQVKNTFGSIKERRRFWEHVFSSRVSELVLAQRYNEADAELTAILASQNASSSHASKLNSGEVYLVGAGPGDPELLTLRAHRLMQQAEVVVYDRLVSEEIMQHCRPDAIKIYAGKKRQMHTLQQHEINNTLVHYARQGYRVLRLKGGDPFIFGRGGEEIEILAENNIPFQVIPGITAASGCSAYAGIPLTHRDHAQACVFVTGHLKNGNLELPWESLAQPAQTVVCYMGLNNLPEICKKLIEHGMDATVPAAIIEKGTTAQQRVITATVDTLAGVAQNENVSSPAVLIFGSVVSLHKQLAWHRRETHQRAQPNSEAASSMSEGMISAAPM